MKKSFCDICGEDLFNRITPIEANYNKGSSPVDVVVRFRLSCNGSPADLCKKCARELLDKIEL